jgi:uncharacterized LabA/DUF88 family protein
MDTLVFIDSGFLSKLSRYFGGGKYLVYDIIKFSENIANRENLEYKKIFYYTAPPFQSNNPTLEERNRRDKYDKFIKKLSRNNKIIIKEGRCQKINSGKYKLFSQKAVDSLMIIDIMSLPLKYKEIKKIILIACDSDFVPVVNEIKRSDIEVILFTYFTKKRNTNFSRSNDLIKSVSKYVLLSKQDFENAPLIK